MFYTQCNNCNERWELGTTNICSCVTNASATIQVDRFSHLGQRTWVGLTDKEIRKWWASENGLEDCDMCKIDDFILVARAIENKLRELNT